MNKNIEHRLTWANKMLASFDLLWKINSINKSLSCWFSVWSVDEPSFCCCCSCCKQASSHITGDALVANWAHVSAVMFQRLCAKLPMRSSNAFVRIRLDLNFVFVLFFTRSRVQHSFTSPTTDGWDGGFFHLVFHQSDHCRQYYASQWYQVSLFSLLGWWWGESVFLSL